MREIPGRKCTVSLASAALQRSLASKLAGVLDVDGCPEYVLTWSESAMPLGPPICVLRASASRISGNVSTGSQPCQDSPSPLVGWATPTATNARVPSEERIRLLAAGETTRKVMTGGEPVNLNEQVFQLIPPRPKKEDSERRSAGGGKAGDSGDELALNPGHSRWLQSYPTTWGRCCPGYEGWELVQRVLSNLLQVPGNTTPPVSGDMATP
jgi:hypothetical protein